MSERMKSRRAGGGTFVCRAVRTRLYRRQRAGGRRPELGGADVRWRPGADGARCDAAMPPPPGPPSRVGSVRTATAAARRWRCGRSTIATHRTPGLPTRRSVLPHPAFRSVSAACAPGIAGAAVKLAAGEDIVYSPDQPDYVFDQGLTVAAWINPTRSPARRASRASASKDQLVRAGDRREEAGVRAQAHQRQDRRCLRGRAGRRPVHARRRHVRRPGRDPLRRRRRGREDARGGQDCAGRRTIFIGNDANGRLLKGVVDSVWLNTLAAPAAVIKELTCIRQPPVVTLSPAMSAPQIAGTTVPYDLSITNANGASCAASTFQYFASVFPPLSTDVPFGSSRSPRARPATRR